MSSTNDQNQPRRFLFVTADRFPPFRVDVSVLFGKELRARGHTIDWVMQAEEESTTGGVNDWGGWDVHVSKIDHRPGIVNRLHKHFLGLLNDLKAWSLVRRGNYDFIQIKDKFLITPLVLLAARLSKTPVIYWLSYPFQDSSIFAAQVGTARYPFLYRIRGHFFRFVLYRLVAPSAKHIIVQSEQMKRDLVAAGIDADKMTAVPMGVEMDAEANPEQVPQPTDVIPAQMIYVGTLLKTRRMDFLVRVLHKVREQVPEATLLMVGPEELPGDADVLRSEAERLGVTEALTITGRLPRDDAFALVRQSAVCFSPFYPTPILNSTSPTKLVEYMSQARPMVANDHPEQRLLIDESAAGFCVPYEEQAFADAAIKLMADPAGAADMGERGYEWVIRNRSYQRLADHVESTYTKILSKLGKD